MITPEVWDCFDIPVAAAVILARGGDTPGYQH